MKGVLRIPARDIAKPRSTSRNLQKENKEGYSIGIMSTGVCKRMVRHIIANIKPRAGQLGANHVEAVLELARSGQSGSSLSLPGGVEVRKERDTLMFKTIENKGARILRSTPHE